MSNSTASKGYQRANWTPTWQLKTEPETSWGAYTPDLPGLVAAGKTLDEVKDLIREAVEFHLEGMRQRGDPTPAPKAITEYITV